MTSDNIQMTGMIRKYKQLSRNLHKQPNHEKNDFIQQAGSLKSVNVVYT